MPIILEIMKEHHRRHLPHFYQPGQEYFVTSNLKGAIPIKALNNQLNNLEILKNELLDAKKDLTKQQDYLNLRKAYYIQKNKVLIHYDDLLAKDDSSEINLNLEANEQIMFNAF